MVRAEGAQRDPGAAWAGQAIPQLAMVTGRGQDVVPGPLCLFGLCWVGGRQAEGSFSALGSKGGRKWEWVGGRRRDLGGHREGPGVS